VSPARGLRGAALFGLLSLSGCGLFSSHKPPPTPCPSAVILRPLANTAVFPPGVPARPENVMFYGLLSEVDRTCEYTPDAVRMTLDVILIGQRGPAAANSNAADLTYFIAATAPNQTVISKKDFSVRIALDPDQIRAGVTDHIVETVALAGHKGTDLSFLLGFQQTPEVVDFYNHFRGR
jgi:hypothetical protein